MTSRLRAVGSGTPALSMLHGCAGSEQVLTVNNERFMVPEALFHPTDIGMNQAGARGAAPAPG